MCFATKPDSSADYGFDALVQPDWRWLWSKHRSHPNNVDKLIFYSIVWNNPGGRFWWSERSCPSFDGSEGATNMRHFCAFSHQPAIINQVLDECPAHSSGFCGCGSGQSIMVHSQTDKWSWVNEWKWKAMFVQDQKWDEVSRVNTIVLIILERCGHFVRSVLFACPASHWPLSLSVKDLWIWVS